MPIVQSNFHTNSKRSVSNPISIYSHFAPIIVIQKKGFVARIAGYDAMRDYCISGVFTADEGYEIKENQIIGSMDLCTGNIRFFSGISGLFHGVIHTAPHALATERKEPRAMGARRGTKGIPCRERGPHRKAVKQVEEMDAED